MKRIDDVANRIITMCVDKAELSVGGLDYLNGNLGLSCDIFNIAHRIKEWLELKLKVDLDGIKFPDPCDYINDELIDEDTDRIDKDEVINRNINNKVSSAFNHALLLHFS